MITRITCLRTGMEMRGNASDPEGSECLIKRAVKAARAGDIGAGDIGAEAEIWGDGGRSRGWKVRLRENWLCGEEAEGRLCLRSKLG